MPTRQQIITWILKPVSVVYGWITAVRNWMFDNKILPVMEYDVPVISVGNITVGGTGKTPHVEYIVNELCMTYNTAVLSRGYKRKTKGFLMAGATSTPDSVGDEPLQIFHKFGSRIKVAVCENRRHGIAELLRQFPDLELIVLDDAFQHRYVKPKVSILLTDYNRPIYSDNLLPLGRLRENWRQVERADMVVVTKCPDQIEPVNMRMISKQLGGDITSRNLNPRPYQGLYFSKVVYGGLLPVFPDDKPYNVNLSLLTERDTVLLLTGIANPRGFVRYFKNYPFKVVVSHYPDHHDFTRKDIESLMKKFSSLSGERKLIITTEKDAIRLAYNPYIPTKTKPLMFYLPIGVRMLDKPDGTDFMEELKRRIEE